MTTGLVDGVQVYHVESGAIRAAVAPSVGGRIVSLIDRATGTELLWRNSALPLRLEAPGAEYDASFYGGIDELLPNDIPELIGDVMAPDHGELWTTDLAAEVAGEVLALHGALPQCKLQYSRRIWAEGARLISEYEVANAGASALSFLWKLHAAVPIEPGDRIVCSAAMAEAADLAYSRQASTASFQVPSEGFEIPETDGSMEFLYLSDLARGEIGYESADGKRRLTYFFDREVFPFCWLFASFGGFMGHRMAILEPCTTKPISVNNAARTARLGAGETLRTSVELEVYVSR